MRIAGVAAIVATGLSLVVAACGGSSTSPIVGVLWQWNGLHETRPANQLSAIPDPQNYLLLFNKDGSFEAKADCGEFHGHYSLSGSKLTLIVGPMRAQCGPNSLADKYAHLLSEVESQTLSDGQLTLGLIRVGSMFFDTA